MKKTRKTRHVHTTKCLRVTTLGKERICALTGERAYLPLTAKQKARAKATVPAMMKELKKGRWKSREQAIAVGLSKARRA